MLGINYEYSYLRLITSLTTTQIWDLGYNVLSAWKTHFFNDQTAGYLTRFKGVRFAFLTVHGAGHEVPTYQPAIAYDMWIKFIAGYFTDHYKQSNE